jgi:polyisoprenoid-binding protein YceI
MSRATLTTSQMTPSAAQVLREGKATGSTVAARSIDTGHRQRDNHLRSADFFDVDSYPAITFTVDKVTPAGTGLTVAGQLSVRGRTRPVSFGLIHAVFTER